MLSRKKRRHANNVYSQWVTILLPDFLYLFISERCPDRPCCPDVRVPVICPLLLYSVIVEPLVFVLEICVLEPSLWVIVVWPPNANVVHNNAIAKENIFNTRMSYLPYRWTHFC